LSAAAVEELVAVKPQLITSQAAPGSRLARINCRRAGIPGDREQESGGGRLSGQRTRLTPGGFVRARTWKFGRE
jgi:hypothetical protein